MTSLVTQLTATVNKFNPVQNIIDAEKKMQTSLKKEEKKLETSLKMEEQKLEVDLVKIEKKIVDETILIGEDIIIISILTGLIIIPVTYNIFKLLPEAIEEASKIASIIKPI